MSYFARLVAHSGLEVGAQSEAGRAGVVSEEEPQRGSGPRFDPDAAPPEVDEVVIASPADSTSAAARDVTHDEPSATASATERLRRAEEPVRAAASSLPPGSSPFREPPGDTAPPSSPASLRAAAPDPVRPAEGPRPAVRASGATASREEMLQRVIAWVTTSPSPRGDPDEQTSRAAKEPGNELPSEVGDAVALPTLGAEDHAFAPLPATRDHAPHARVSASPTVVRERPQARREAPVEEVVSVSIGTVSVRIEGPTSPAASPEPLPAPRPVPPPARPSEHTGSRFARRYLRP